MVIRVPCQGNCSSGAEDVARVVIERTQQSGNHNRDTDDWIGSVCMKLKWLGGRGFWSALYSQEMQQFSTNGRSTVPASAISLNP